MSSGVVAAVSRGANSCGLVIDGQNGIVFDTRNPEHLVDKLLQLCQDRRRYGSIVDGGLETVGQIRKQRALALRELNMAFG